MKKCINCKSPNPDQWFYCRKCGNKSSDSKFTTNLYMMSEAGKRTDIEFSTITIDEDIKSMNRRNNHA